jgi:hypothetical protein
MVDHVVVALTSSDEATLPEILGSDPIVPLTGALVRTASLEPIAGNQAILSLLPADNLVKWVREASRLAAIRPGDNRLNTSDLIAVLSSPDVDPNVRQMLQRTLQQARSAGHTPTQLERVRQDIDSFKQTTSRHRSESNSSFDEVTAAIAAANAHIGNLTGLTTAVDTCRNQLADLNRRTAEIGDTQLASLADTIGDCRRQLANLEYQTAAIKAGLPRPPAAGWIAFAIMTVLVLGSTAGIALSDASLFWEVLNRVRGYIVS